MKKINAYGVLLRPENPQNYRLTYISNKCFKKLDVILSDHSNSTYSMQT